MIVTQFIAVIVALQVPLLLSLASGTLSGATAASSGGASDDKDILSRALSKSVEAGDPDLVHLVMFHVFRRCPLPEFWQLISGRSLARNLFFKHARAKVGRRNGAWLSCFQSAGVAIAVGDMGALFQLH